MLVASESALEGLVRRVLALRGLAGAVESPLRLPFDAPQIESLNRIAAGLGVRPFSARAGGAATSFEGLALTHLAIDGELEGLLAGVSAADIDEAVRLAAAGSLEWDFVPVDVPASDGAVLRAYAGGARDGEVIALVTACGMPIELSEAWMRELGRSHFIVTWESRGLFGGCADFDALAHGVDAQAGDLRAVLNHFGVASAHLMGLCGGAVIALAAAADEPERWSSLSLWYGDFDLGDAAPKTKHQRELIRLLAMLRAGRKEAASLQRLFLDPSMLASARRDVAHLIMYPYAGAELLYRYACLNGAIMEYDVRPLLARIPARTLVVTSEDDATAHPEGSRRVAEGIPAARLHVEQHGDHLTLFDARAELAGLAREFLAAG
jgi:pimeloyl-ACP methyl ester carboxylesterase